METVLNDATTPGTLNLKLAREMRTHIDAVNTEIARQQELAKKDAEEAQQLREGVIDDKENLEVEETDSETAGDEPSGDEEVVEETSPVTAGLSDAALRALQSARTRSAREGADDPAPPAVQVTVAGPALGARTPDSLRDVANIFYNHAHRTSRGKQPLVSLSMEYPTNRRLTNGATENTRLLTDLLSSRAITASGGICEPLPADFSHPICGDRGRPIRDALPRFNAGQGGVRFAPSATLADLAVLGGDGPVSVWTHDTDLAPSDAVKPCPHVDCEPEVEVFVDAVTACLEVGNFQARFNPEFWRSQLDLLMVLHDRIAEQTLHATMVSLATAVTFATVDGNTATTLFISLDRAISGLRSRHRLLGTQFRFIGPSWLRDAIRASIARQRSDDPSNFAVADAVINGFFNSRGINATWSPDIDLFGAQTAGALLTWPGDNAQYLLYPEGTYFFLDGGTLDLGTEITDSTLNATNDRQAFLETFENVAFRGCEGYAVTVPVGEDCVCENVTT
jgi:hypothetical protein